MNEQEIRTIVRDVLARRATVPSDVRAEAPPARPHPSHGIFILPVGADTDGPCIIEPTVACNHCGYCKSYGH